MDALRNYIKELRIYAKPLTEEEEKELAEKVAKGDPKARDKMIQANLRLVVSLAKHYVNMGMPFVDLIAYGNIGLMRAVDKFRPDMGFRFSTYAAWWIRQSIIRALMKNSNVLHVPVHINTMIQKMRHVEKELTEKLKRPPTEIELAQALGTTMSRVGQLINCKDSTASLNIMVGSDKNTELIDIVGAIADHSIKEEVQKSLDYETLLGLMDNIRDKERYVLDMRFGFVNNRPRTLAEIAEAMDISREAVRKIEERAIKKLQSFINRELNLIKRMVET